MSVRDFLLTVFVCFMLATSAIVTKLVVTELNVPPLAFVTARSIVIVGLMAPWLFPIPRPRIRFLVTSTLLGLGGFTLFYMGLAHATPSAAAIVQQISIPLTGLFGVLFLGEKIDQRQTVGTALALIGIIIVVAKPESLNLSNGLLWVAASALCGSIAVVLIKTFSTLEPSRLQSWVGACAGIPAVALSSLFESAAWQRAWNAGWAFAAASLYSAVVISILAQGINYRLVHRNNANVMAPLMVMGPLFTMILGYFITHDAMTPAMLTGAAITITGIIIISYRKRTPADILPEVEIG